MTNEKAKLFIENCKRKYGKQIPKDQNAMGIIVKHIDIQKVSGFTWINSILSWGICEAGVAQKKEKGALRTIWYRDVKQFYQNIMGREFNDEKAVGLLSDGLATLVRSREFDYEDFAIEDSSYCMEFPENGIQQLNAILFCEKSSELSHFKRSCEILGIKALAVGSGRPNLSTSEYLYKNFFDGYIDSDHPLRTLILTDHDYDGHIPIGRAFSTQMGLFASNVVSARIGLNLDQIPEKRRSVKDALYEVKQSVKNVPKSKWMENNLVVDPNTGLYLGAEVESNEFSYYYPLIWDALKETGIEYENYIEARYQKVRPSNDHVGYTVAKELLEDELKDIEDEIERLQNEKSVMIAKKKAEIMPTVEEESNKDEYVYFQNHLPEKSIVNALKQQKNWSGGIRKETQFNKLVEIVVNIFKGRPSKD